VASEDDKAQGGWYRFTGMKNAWDETSALVLEGSATNPKVVINKGEETELTAEQVESARSMGARLSAVSDEKVKALEEERSDDDAESTAPRGSEQRPQAETGTTQPADVARAAEEKSGGGSKSKS
jgi:hypothetical protein